MSTLDDIYNNRILELAAAIPRTTRLTTPTPGVTNSGLRGLGATASARSKLCGSEITVDLTMADGRVTDYGQSLKACLLGQAAASVMGREIVGTTPAELRDVARTVRGMLKDKGSPPVGRWADLAILQPVREYKHRHDAVLIVFDAVLNAVSQIEANADAATVQGHI